MFQLQIQDQQDGFLPRLVAFGGIIIVFLSVAFLIFLVFSRRQQNRLVLKQRAMAVEFERQLMTSMIEVQESTLLQIGQELHDNIGQLLSSTKLLLGITERGLQPVPASLLTAGSTLGLAIRDLRSLTKSLNSEWLHQFNLVENIQAEAERIRTSNQIGIRFHSSLHMLPLEPKEQVMAFRVIQEALQNSIKHSGASELDIHISLEAGQIYLSVADNGSGFDREKMVRSGVGLMNMKHRTQLLGGAIEWKAGEDCGTKVTIKLPVKNTTI